MFSSECRTETHTLTINPVLLFTFSNESFKKLSSAIKHNSEIFHLAPYLCNSKAAEMEDYLNRHTKIIKMTESNSPLEFSIWFFKS